MDLDYDWYVFLDDDSFVFTDRYMANLSNLDCTKNLYVGLQYSYGGVLYMSGGATFSLSKGTYELVKNYVRNTDMETVQNTNQVMIHGDYSMGRWIYNINNSMTDNKDKITLLNLPFLLCPNCHKDDDELKNSSSFHYLNNESQYKLYGDLIG
jgi:hypothetical protein